MSIFNNLDYYLGLIYDAATKSIRFSPSSTAPTPGDIGSYTQLDEVLQEIYDPTTQSLRINISGGDTLKQKNQKIVCDGSLSYELDFLPRGELAVTEKGGGRVDPDDVGGIAVQVIADKPYIVFGVSAPPAGITIFVDYIY